MESTVTTSTGVKVLAKYFNLEKEATWKSDEQIHVIENEILNEPFVTFPCDERLFLRIHTKDLAELQINLKRYNIDT